MTSQYSIVIILIILCIAFAINKIIQKSKALKKDACKEDACRSCAMKENCKDKKNH